MKIEVCMTCCESVIVNGQVDLPYRLLSAFTVMGPFVRACTEAKEQVGRSK